MRETQNIVSIAHKASNTVKTMHKLSVHLVVYNSEKYLPYCLEALHNQSFKDFSVLIIDNCSSDETIAIIEDFLKNPMHKFLEERTTIIKNAKNIGFASAHNQAIQWTKSEVICLMNPDILMDQDYFKHCVEFLDQHPTTAAVSGALFQWDFNQCVSNESDSSLTEYGKTDRIDTLGLELTRKHKVLEISQEPLPDHPFEVFGVSGALPLYKRSALQAVQVPLFEKSFKIYLNQTKPKLYEYFDTDFFCYKEDVDLAYRFRLFGFSAYTVPKARAWHDRTGLARSNLSTIKNRRAKSAFVNYHSYKNHLFALIKNVPSRILIRYFFQICFYELTKFFYILLFEYKTFRSFKEILQLLPKMIKKRAFIERASGKNGWRSIEPWLS